MEKRYKRAAKDLLIEYVGVHASQFEKMLKLSFDVPNWLKMKEPREVRLVRFSLFTFFFVI